MSFPLALTTELLLDGTWTDVTSDVYDRDAIEISRGRSDESATPEPSRCSLTLDNRTGDYSPRNPVGTHFGVIGRNTQLRVLTPAGLDNYMGLPGREASYVSTPDAASLDITGDIDIRIEIDPFTWRPVAGFALARKYFITGDQRSWAFWLATDGTLSFRWSSAGTSGTVITAASTAAVPSASGRLALRVTLDVNNGAAGNDVKFYTASAIDGSWTQLGATVTTPGVTSIFASTATLQVGTTTGSGGEAGVEVGALQGSVYGFELLSGIAGSVVASLDFPAQDSATTSFADAQGLTWTLQRNAVIANPNARFHGEVSVWPQRWDSTGTDVYSPIKASGILRRLGQGTGALKSTLYRGLTTREQVVAYWPCEDGENATELASALPDYPTMHIWGDVDTASFSSFVASDPLPTAVGAQWWGAVPTYTITGESQMTFLLAVPAGGVASTSQVCRLRTSGTAQWWTLHVNTAGDLRLQAFNSADVQIADSGFIASHAANGKLLRVSIDLDHTTADVDWAFATLEVGSSTVTTTSGTLVGRTVGRIRWVSMNVGGILTDTALGHISVETQITSLFDLSDELNAYTGERATDRLLRLCAEEGVPVTLVGDVGDAALLGYQQPMTLVDLLREAADADLGILYEPREHLGLAYRTKASLYAQAAGLELDYATADLSSIEPVEDDQGTRNDITVKRKGGSSARAELTSGPLSVNAPPDGVGRYDEQVDISLSDDLDLPDQAGWRLHLGTVDEPRYPVIAMNLARGAFTGDAALTTAAEMLDVGGKITVANLPAWMPPDDVTQLAQGFTETLTRFEWWIEANCSPGSPWDVGVWDDDDGAGEARYSSDGTTTTEDLTTTETGVDVSTPTGPVWGTADLPYDIAIGGERMTVTAVTGTSAAQTLTVTRSVNGVVKTHLSGAEVRLFKPAIYAL